ncbi:MAG: hypothetical protein LBJ84_04850 [Oscillospiraceae bacterium]|jgi:hypothetical protein|nr:hypothetical protein [Oscillospiraceae bacterium]
MWGISLNDVVNRFVPNSDAGVEELHAFMRVNGKVTDIGGVVKDYQPDASPPLNQQVDELVYGKQRW